MNINQNESISQNLNMRPLLDKDHGYYHSANLTLPVDVVYKACQDKNNIQRVLDNLPEGVVNFLSLTDFSTESIGEGQYRIVWENGSDSKFSGTVTFLLRESIGRPGTWITAEANFGKLNFRDEGPSTLINIFLKRMKALIETGEIPTTKGQPSGREEVSESKDQTLH